MKLLYDQNLSPRLVDRLADLYPNSKHVYEIGLDQSNDGTLWTYAQHHDFIIVWIRRGNCSTRDIETMLRSHFDTIQSLNENPNAGILTLF